MARRVVAILVRREQREWQAGALKEEFAKRGLDKEKAFRLVTEGPNPVVKMPLSRFGKPDDWTCWVTGDDTPMAQTAFDDALAIVDPRGKEMAVTFFQLDGQWFESAPYCLKTMADRRMFALIHALGDDTASLPPSQIIDDCRLDLGNALFPPDSGVAKAVLAALEVGRRLRIRLHAGGSLGTLPWEVAKHPDAERHCSVIDDDHLAVARLVGARSSTYAGSDWLHWPIVEYVCLAPKVDYWNTLKKVADEIGWSTLCLDPDEFLARRIPTPPSSRIVHLVAHHTESKSDEERMKEIVAAVLAREPTLAFMALCFSGRDGPRVPSLARRVSTGGVPYVVGLHGDTELGGHREFVPKFYTDLSRHGVEDAMYSGRQAVGGNALQRLQFLLFQHGHR